MIKLKKSTTAKPLQHALELTDCLAKTYNDIAGKKQAGRRVLNHCEIVGHIARELRHRLPDNLVAEFLPAGSELIAAAHDIGKVSPCFQEKIYRGTDGYVNHSKTGLETANPDLEKSWGGHAGVSQATATYLKLGKYIPEILGQHHGYSPNVGNLATDEPFGDLPWEQRREELLAHLKALLQTDFPAISSELQARVLAGLTAVSDWIGSGSLFDDPAEDWRPRIRQALDTAGFISPRLKTGLHFQEIFDFQPHDVQQCFIQQVNQPGVYILEAPMGLGKTEAALYAAYQMLDAKQATGIYFALPTQLTSDKIHQRVKRFLGKILHDDSQHQQPLLLHGHAWLKTELGKEGNPGGEWFQAAKRGILAPFAVGTIDQALMAVMNVKHGFVRTFGLVGKVVILDEVHSYDSYTGTLLDELVLALRQLNCTVIILSATLTAKRRQAMLGNEAGCLWDYPLITAAPRQGDIRKHVTAPLVDVVAKLMHCLSDELAIEEALLRAEQGQQVLWVENTVAEAQRIYTLLAARECSPKIECGLLHSRFLKIDREHNENYWTALYGKDADADRAKAGRILVGTQVLEQSLDIDADFLISRIAPTDMLLQRLGRLWRHHSTWRPATARREIWLLRPRLIAAIADPKQALGATAKVYSPYVLCRSLEVWQDLDHVMIPAQIRELIEATYDERDETGDMLIYLNQLNSKRDKLQSLALLGLSTAGTTLPEQKASTRYNDQDTVDVLLIKSYRIDTQNAAVNVQFLDGTTAVLPDKGKGLQPLQRRELAAKLLQNTVRVADYLAPKPIAGNGLDWLGEYLYLGKQEPEEYRLRVAEVLESGQVVSLNYGVASDSYIIRYDQFLGYQTSK